MVVALPQPTLAKEVEKPGATIAVSEPFPCPGDVVTVTAKGFEADATVEWSSDSPQRIAFKPPRGLTSEFRVPGKAHDSLAPAGDLTINATALDVAEGPNPTIVVHLGGPCPPPRGGGEITEAVVGYEQVGASGTSSDQKYFFNFFISRPLPLGSTRSTHPDWGPRWRWWGNVRFGSSPQQVNSSVAQFGASFATTAGKVPLNQLAQELDFTTGVERRLGTSLLKTSLSDATTTRNMFTLFAGFGASGPNNPSDAATVYAVPADSSSQYQALKKAYDSVTPATKYLTFLPDRTTHFLRQWEVGARLYTLFGTVAGRPLSSAPGLVQLSLGQNELTTAGRLSGVVVRAAAVYPFALGDRTKPGTLVIFLFGEASTALGRQSLQPLSFALTPATDWAGKAIPLTDPNVTIINVPPNRRDVYRVGVGIDLGRVWSKLSGSGS